jgi:plasmid replication initiation protein
MKKAKDSKRKSITLIKKSNDLIEARYMFDIWETRFFLSVLSQIHMEDVDFKTYRIKYKDVIKTFGLKSNSSYAHLRDAAKKMMDRKVAISYENEGVVRETLYHIIRKVDYMKENEEGRSVENQEYVDVSVEPEIKPLLLQLQKNFTAYELQNVVRLGVYPIRIYELLKQYENIGYRVLTIEQLKKMFELTKEYPRFSNFYQKIIQPAIKEINLHTDLKIIDVERRKEGKNVVALKFIFTGKRTAQTQHEILEIQEPIAYTLFQEITPMDRVGEEELILFTPTETVTAQEDETNRLFLLYQQNVVSNYGVTPTIFIQALEGKSEEDVTKAIRVTEVARKKGEIKNLAGFFIQALRQGFTNEREENHKKQQAIQERKAVLQQELEALREEREHKINEKIRELRNINPSLTQEMIAQIEASAFLNIFLDAKRAKLGRNLELEDYRQDIELRKLVKQGFIEKFKPDFLTITVGYDEKILIIEKTLSTL